VGELKIENLRLRIESGFTLIELLVTIAVIGVMMGAVIVAINPAKRLADARDADGKQRVASVALAMEACFTKNLGSYANCDSITELVNGGYLKQDPGGITFYDCTSSKCCLYYDLENGDYWAYESACGKAQERSSVTTCPTTCP